MNVNQPLQKCDNCHKNFPQSKINTHFGYCRRNIKKCAECGEMYDINEVQQHEEEFHKKQKCSDCGIQLPLKQLPNHKKVCKHRTKFCQYCDLDVPFKQFDTHFKACQSRTKNCQKCNQPVTNKDYLVHIVSCEGPVKKQPTYHSYQQYSNQNQRRFQKPTRVQPPSYEPTRVQYQRRQATKAQPSKVVYANKDNKYTNIETKPVTRVIRQEPSKNGEIKSSGIGNSTSNAQHTNIYGVNRAQRKVQTSGVQPTRKVVSNTYKVQQKRQAPKYTRQSYKAQQKKQVPKTYTRQPTYTRQATYTRQPTTTTTTTVRTHQGGIQRTTTTRTSGTSGNSGTSGTLGTTGNRIASQTGVTGTRVITNQPKVIRHQVRQVQRRQYVPQRPAYNEQIPPQLLYQDDMGGVPSQLEDQQLQKAIMMSMEGSHSRSKPKPPAEDFLGLSPDMMNQSFISKQRAIEQQFSKRRR